MGETRVDLLHLLEDLRDAYPTALEETILTEIIANALDSGARRIRLMTSPESSLMTVVDDGSGMRRRELARYHDLATTTKTRGQGIGFAGVGIKLGLLACTEVLTESQRGKSHVATRWHLASRHRAPWKWTTPPGLLHEHGTAVQLGLHNPLSPLLDASFLEATLRRQFHPLLDPFFDEILMPRHPHGVQFELNGRPMDKRASNVSAQASLEVRLGRQRKPSAVGYLLRQPHPVPEDEQGIAVSTLGKVIKRGWDWLGISPAARDCVGGLIEVPALASCLTLNKGDFIRIGPRGATYLAYRKALQEAVSRQLATWGDIQPQPEEARRRVLRPLERDMEQVLVDLAHEFPLLASLVDTRRGGQKHLPVGSAVAGGSGTTDGHAFVTASIIEDADRPADHTTDAREEEPAAAGPSPPTEPQESEQTGITALHLPDQTRRRRVPATYTLSLQFESRPDDVTLGRLIESTVLVNDAHPAYRRAVLSRSEGYHLALAVALALAPLASETGSEHRFVNAFLSHWGASLQPASRRRPPR